MWVNWSKVKHIIKSIDNALSRVVRKLIFYLNDTKTKQMCMYAV